MKLRTLFFLSIICHCSLAQTFQLNNIKQENEDVVDVQIQNRTDETIYLLRVESNPNVTSRIYSKQIPPRRTVPLRLKLNPKQRGNLSEEVKLYLSHQPEPIRLLFNAKVQNTPQNNRQACPSFGGGGGFTLNPKTGVYEKEEAGEFQKVNLKLENPIVEEEPTQLAEASKEDEKEDKPIQEQEKEPLAAKKEKLSPEERRNQPSLLEKLFGNNDTTIQAKEDLKEEIKDSISNPLDPALLGSEYKPNNIVFLIDASTSMREGNKMELLQETMIELLKPLRAQDYLSIVTYAGNARLLLPPSSGMEKALIQKEIENIEAEGSTQAVKGLKLALQTGNKQFIEGGNNIIILATDGAFDIGKRNKSLRRKIEKNAAKGLETWVLGIKNEKWTKKSLKEITDLGEGELIRCKNKGDTKKVLKEVKKSALL